MTPELFPSDRSLPLLHRVLYVLCAVFGTVVLFFALLMIAIEITTTPGVSRATVWLTIISGAVSVVHIVREAGSTRSFSLGQWSVFLIAQAVFCYELWTTIRDPTGRVFFLAWVLMGSGALLVARLIMVTRSHPPNPGGEDESPPIPW